MYVHNPADRNARGADTPLGALGPVRRYVSPFQRRGMHGYNGHLDDDVANEGLGDWLSDAIGGAGTGAATGSAVPGIGTAIGGIAGAVSGLLKGIGGGGTPDQMKAIWSAVPASVIRISGGHGQWTDTLTGEQMGDAGTDLRKSAVVASALGMFNDAKNWWYDDATGQYVSGAQALAKWQSYFGNQTFAQAYASSPQSFKIFGNDPSQDPSQATQSTAMPVRVGTPTPGTNVATLPVVATSSGKPATLVQQASIFGNASPTTIVLVIGVAVLGTMAFSRREERN